jgi:hypothetical protein
MILIKFPICDVFHRFCKIARFFTTEPQKAQLSVTKLHKLVKITFEDVLMFRENLMSHINIMLSMQTQSVGVLTENSTFKK